jgi:TP901 family phage tail tape measure protein
MSKTASIASSAGMSFETTAAFLTNMIETTQEAPENIGTAMKTIIARFTELKENVSAADSEFDDLDYNKVDKALKSVGIQLKDANG